MAAERPDPGAAPRVRGFQELMRRRVRRALLVSSLYDSFVLSEDGRVVETILAHFLEVGRRRVPDVVPVHDTEAALARLEADGEFDVIMPGTFLDSSEEARFVERLEKEPPALVIWPGWPFDSDRDRGVQKTAPLLSRWALDHYAPRDPRSQSHRFVILVPRGAGANPTPGSREGADSVPR